MVKIWPMYLKNQRIEAWMVKPLSGGFGNPLVADWILPQWNSLPLLTRNRKLTLSKYFWMPYALPPVTSNQQYRWMVVHALFIVSNVSTVTVITFYDHVMLLVDNTWLVPRPLPDFISQLWKKTRNKIWSGLGTRLTGYIITRNVLIQSLRKCEGLGM